MRDEEGSSSTSAGDAAVYERPDIAKTKSLASYVPLRSMCTEPLLLKVLDLEDGVTLSAEDVLDLPDGDMPDQGTEYLFRKEEPVMLIHARGRHGHQSTSTRIRRHAPRSR